MNKNKKRMAKGIAAAALIGVIAVGSTLAYLSATTGTKTNTFTGSNKNITGETTEEFESDKASNYTPGEVIKKNPSISINANSESAYAALSVDYFGDDVKTKTEEGKVVVEDGTKMSQTAFKKYAEVTGWNLGEGNTAWKLIATSANGSELYMYNAILAPKADAAAAANELFTGTKVNAGLRTITTEELAKETTIVYTYTDTNKNGKWDTGEPREAVSDKSVIKQNTTTSTDYIDGNGNTLAVTSLPPFVIDIKGFAVQSTNVELAEAKAELIKLANDGREDDDVFVAVV